MNLLRLEGFVKVNVIGQKYLNRRRQIKFCCGSKGISKSHILQYSQGCTKFLASIELFNLFPIWFTVENILIPVFTDYISVGF